MKIEGLDKTDNAILEVIQDHARMRYSDIGAKAGLSRVAVKNRMDILEKKGIRKMNWNILIHTIKDVDPKPVYISGS